jgi:hypothetical protein
MPRRSLRSRRANAQLIGVELQSRIPPSAARLIPEHRPPVAGRRAALTVLRERLRGCVNLPKKPGPEPQDVSAWILLMTRLLAANPKAKDRALARAAVEQIGPSPLTHGTLRKRFGVLKKAGRLPALLTADDLAEREIEQTYKARDRRREQDQAELTRLERDAQALGLDLAVDLDELVKTLYHEKSRLEITLWGGASFFAGQMMATIYLTHQPFESMASLAPAIKRRTLPARQ